MLLYLLLLEFFSAWALTFLCLSSVSFLFGGLLDNVLGAVFIRGSDVVWLLLLFMLALKASCIGAPR
jgi:hypothetical protein